MVSLRGLISKSAQLAFLLLATKEASAAKDIEDLFVVSFSSRVGGNCATYGKARINTLVTEALGLLDAGIKAVDHAKIATAPTSDQAWRVLFTFFHDPSSSDWDFIKTTYQDLQRFLNNGGSTNNGASTNKPYLFCGDSWAFRQDMSSQMYDASGVKTTKADGTPFLIRDNPDFVAAQTTLTAKKGETVYPYYSEEVGEYFFDVKYGDDPTAGYCGSSAKSQGATSSRSGNLGSVVILCPQSFTNRRVRAVAANPVQASDFSNNRAPPGAQRLPDISPEVSTFLHELFHLVRGSALTYPDPDEEYGVRRMLEDGYPKASALKNPETYTNVAIAYDYTINHARVNNKPVEFYTGWCSIQD